MTRNRFFLAALAALAAPLFVQAKAKPESLMFVGTYTGQGSDGIYAYRFNAKTGVVTPLGLAGKVTSPSFLAISPDRKSLYAVSEVGRGATVSAWTIDHATGKLTFINDSADPGAGPCFVTTDRTGRVVLIANYGGGSVASYRVGADGKLSPVVSFIQHEGGGANSRRQERPHAHSINLSPDNRFAIAADLGTDELRVYKLDAATGKLTPNDPPATKLTAGDGPRHFTFHPTKPYAYVITELHNTVTLMNWDARAGALKPVESVSSLPPDFKGESNTAEVQVHPNGKFLYGSNRGLDTIAVFTLDRKTGKLKLIQNEPTRGSFPRNFRIDPTGKWLIAANQKGNNMSVYRIDKSSGKLTVVGDPILLNQPVCIKFVPAR